jgi:hypothetical protein
MQTYTACFQWTLEEYLSSLKHHYQLSVRSSLLLVLNCVMALLVALSGFVLLIGSVGWPDALGTVAFGAVCACWFVRKPLLTSVLAASFRRRADVNAWVTWKFCESNLAFDILGHRSVSIAWKSVRSVTVTQEGLLLYILPKYCYWVPFSAFDDPEAVEAVKALLLASEVMCKIAL